MSKVTLEELGLGADDLAAIGKLSEKGLSADEIADAVEKASELVGQDLVTQTELTTAIEGIDALTPEQTATLDKLDGLGSSALEIDGVVNSFSKKADLSYSKNLFNKNDSNIVIDKYINNTTGALETSTSYITTGYIEIKDNQIYSLSRHYYLGWYTKDLIFISGSKGPGTSASVTSPISAKYIRVSIVKTMIDIYQIEEGNYSTAYSQYSYPSPKILKKISTSEMEIYEKSKNLFSLQNLTLGFWVKYTDGTLGPSAKQYASDFIEILPNTSYYVSGNFSNSSAFYDSSYNFISGINAPLKMSPANAKYIRLTVDFGCEGTIQLEQNTIATYYEKPYKLKSIYETNPISRWNNKIWATLGDSITSQLLWQKSIVHEHKLTLVNNGVGGSTVAGSLSTCFAEGTRVAAMPADADIISVMGGTNDWSTSIALGTISDTGTATFYGALNTLIGLLLSKYPNKRIFFMTTPYGEMYNYISKGWSNAYTNSLGLTVSDYAEAIKLICKKYKLPYVDIHNEAGWNNINIRTYITDDGGLLHPNILGAERISSLVSNFLYKM